MKYFKKDTIYIAYKNNTSISFLRDKKGNFVLGKIDNVIIDLTVPYQEITSQEYKTAAQEVLKDAAKLLNLET